jgi:crotonobetainyl-CoA:carnitine CoA-transferase CaiB-like acyl-CoA transferase
MTGPVEGIRILEIGDRGEAAGLLLAAAGADVVRVEMPGYGSRGRRQGPFVGDKPGTESSLHHAYFNVNKRGITLDPSTADGLTIWRRLLERADVVIDSTGPGVLDEVGAGQESFKSLIDEGKLIWCAITPFGLTGPWKDWEVTDLIQIALGGPMMSTGYDDHDIPPIRPDGEHSLWMGAEFAAIGILAALYEREQSGLGQIIDVSIHESISCTVEGAFPNWEYAQRLVQRQTGRHSSPARTAPWQFMAADGNYINLMGGGIPRTRGNWKELMAWLEEFDAAEDLNDPKYEQAVHSDPMVATQERARIAEVIGAFVKTRPAEEIYRRGQALHLPWAVIRRPEQNLDDPHWEARGFFSKIEIPGWEGEAKVPTAPYMFSETPNSVRRRAPMLGEHNFEVFNGELGLDTQQLVALTGHGAI